MEILSASSFKSKIFDFDRDKEWKFAGSIPAIVDFYADWCGPCRMQTPVLEEIMNSYAGRVNVYKVNTEKTPELAAMFRIRGIPSLLFVPLEGKPFLTSGFMDKAALETAIRDLFKIGEKL
jgi:thioredoxin 1